MLILPWQDQLKRDEGNPMTMIHIAGYRFIALDDLVLLKQNLSAQCSLLALKGTILLSHEGININLAGNVENIGCFHKTLKEDTRFATMRFHESNLDALPFKRLKIKIKNEIITFRQKEVSPLQGRAESVSPVTLKKW